MRIHHSSIVGAGIRAGWLCLGLGAALAVAALPVASMAQTATVPFYHNSADHAGMFVVPGLTAHTVSATRYDAAFDGTVSGVVYAAPLYWRAPGASQGSVIVVTENNQVSALNERTGKPVWTRMLGKAAAPASGCGNIDPLGATGTPVIDAASARIYVEAVVSVSGQQVHDLFALSLSDGSVVRGYPVSIGAGIRALGQTFSEPVQEQRGALALLGSRVYVPFGGYDGDCGAYRGIVAAVDVSGTPTVSAALATTAKKGGVWAPGGVVSDGSSVYFSTGNTFLANKYAGGEAIVRADAQLSPIRLPGQIFSPANWQQLDNDDYDLGGVAPTLLDLAGSVPPHLALGLGKDGNAYLLNRLALGGVGKALQTVAVSGLYTHTATARYVAGSSAVVAYNVTKPFCASGMQAIQALTVSPGSPPAVASRWCTPINGRGDPIVTSSDGSSDPIVWATGAEGDQMLHAFDGLTGAALFSGTAIAGTVHHFTTVLVANGKLFVPSDNRIVAYTLGGAH